MDSPSTPDPELTRPHLSCRAIKSTLAYLEAEMGRERMDELIRSTGMDPAFLLDENNWVSFEYQHRLLARIVEVTGDPGAAFKAGTFAASSQSPGALFLVLRTFGTPELVYRGLPEFLPRMARTGAFTVHECRNGRATLELRMNPPSVQNRLNCDNIRGQLAAIPTAWGFPMAEVEEVHCQVDGASSCLYRVRWVRPPAMHLMGLSAGLVVGAAASWLWLPFLADLLQKLLVTGLTGLLGYLAGLVYYQGATLAENRIFSRRQTDALTENMQAQERRYLQLRKAHQAIRRHSKEMTTLYRVATVAGRKTLLREAVPEILDTLVEADLGIHQAMILLVEEGRQPVAWQRSSSKAPDGEGARGVPVEMGERAMGALLEGRPLPLEELGEVRLGGVALDGILESAQTITLPLVSSGRPLGLLVLGSQRATSAGASSSFAVTLAGEVALALEHCFAWAAVESLLASLPVAVVILDGHFQVAYLNPAFRVLFDEPPDLPTLRLDDLAGLPEQLRAVLAEEARRAFAGSPGGPAEVDCGRRVIAYRSFELRQKEAQRLQVGFALTDVTEHKKLLRQIIQSERLAGIGTLASGVAHEINNPLYAIMGLAEAICDRAEPPEVRRHAQKIVEYSDSIGGIVQELSRYSRAPAGDRLPVDLARCVEKALALLRHHREFRHAPVDTDLQPAARVLGSEQELVQVTLNLVRKAVQATDGRGPVRVFTGMEGGRPVLGVQDGGPGFPRRTGGDSPTRFSPRSLRGRARAWACTWCTGS